MKNYYAQAIQVLSDAQTDLRALAYEIAKVNPKSVATAAERLTTGFGWQKQCMDLKTSGASDAYISAIKLCRKLTGRGLKEAKDAVDAL